VINIEKLKVAVWEVDRHIQALCSAQQDWDRLNVPLSIGLEDSLDLSVDLVVKEPGKDKPIYNLAKAQGLDYDRAFTPPGEATYTFATNA